MVSVYELGYQECAKAYVFRGTKYVGPQQVAGALGLGEQRAASAQQNSAGGAARFMQPVSECFDSLTDILTELQGKVTKAALENRIPEMKKVEILREIRYIEESMFQQFVSVAAFLKRQEKAGVVEKEKKKKGVGGGLEDVEGVCKVVV